ncbi:endonuclease/exonuclease/phosphatase family protein [Agrobacterium vitis]|uniref:Endonuclease/exonuclease/phosphatase family protein n=1 Tax=Agrobacterium vitis TaxID=373 RepID=A0A6L6VMP4_AGRVI|nr:endonuclease/exonuclease/phosphatase family protein [Agrobacterium vitis]MUZ76168.1 endonuclease/exonuclease/phosphatase family protein [Agrobacterium vitis]
MRILSLNAWAGRIYPELLNYLIDVNPDVMCLQEVLRSRNTSAEWLLYRDDDVEFHQRANLFDDVRTAFPDHDAYFCSSMRGELLDGGTPVWVEFGLATLVRRSYSVIGQAMDFVHGEFSSDGWGPHPRPRNVHVMRLFNFDDSTATTIANIHGLRGTDGKHDNPDRHIQAQALLDLIRRVWRPGEKLIVCGDFNVLPGSVTFEILGSAGLIDLVTAHGITDTRTSHYRKPERYADYILATRDIEVIRFEAVESPEVSDHRALLLEFE